MGAETTTTYPTLRSVENAGRVTALGAAALDILTTFDLSGLTGIALVTGVSSRGLRKILETK